MGASINTGNGQGKGGRRARARRHAPMSEINVTPFVDVMLVLLVIFMVTAPLLTVGVPLDLPSAKGNQLEASKEPLVVSIKSGGEIFMGQEDKTPISLDDLVARLKVMAQNRGSADEPIFVRGEKTVEYGVIARVMGRIRDAGFRKISLVTEVEGGG
jgi:biopolymer transport protein TolR